MLSFINVARAVFFALCVLLFVTAPSGCASLGGVADKAWPKVAHCGEQVADDVIGSVVEVLMQGASDQTSIGDKAVSELEQLGAEHGFELVACLVDQFVEDMTRPGAAQSPDRMAMVARGRDFLAKEEIQIVKGGASQ